MNWRDVLSKVFTKQEKFTKEKQQSYWQTVRAIVLEGKEPQPEKLEMVLQQSGKTLEQFQTDCELIEKRTEWKTCADELPAIQKEQASLQSQRDKVFEEFLKIKAKHDEKLQAIRKQQEIIADRERASQSAVEQLKRTFCNEMIDAGLAELQAERKRRCEKMNRAKEYFTNTLESLRKAEYELDRLPQTRHGAGEIERQRGEVQRLSKQTEERKAAWQEADAHWRALDTDQDKLELQKLEV